MRDLDRFHSVYKQMFGSPSTPCFLLGQSLGGLFSAFLSSNLQDWGMKYNGAIHAVPYYALHDSKNQEKLTPILQGLAKTSPNKQIPFNEGRSKKHLAQWMNDPVQLGGQITPSNLLHNIEVMERFNRLNVVGAIDTPTLVVVCGKDRVVSNSKIYAKFDQIAAADKHIISYDDVDHCLFLDGEYMPLIVKDMAAWMDMRLGPGDKITDRR